MFNKSIVLAVAMVLSAVGATAHAEEQTVKVRHEKPRKFLERTPQQVIPMDPIPSDEPEDDPPAAQPAEGPPPDDAGPKEMPHKTVIMPIPEEAPPAPPPAPVKEPVAQVTPPPAPEKAQKETRSGLATQKYFMPSGQGGMVFGCSKGGQQDCQVGRTTSWAGISGGIEPSKGLFFEYRFNWYFDRPQVEWRDSYFGVRLRLGKFESFLRLGADEGFGESPGVLYYTSTWDDPKTEVAGTFGHPQSLIFGFSYGPYILVRGEGNEEKKFRAAALDLHLGPVFFTGGYRTALDEMGQVGKLGLALKHEFSTKFSLTDSDGKRSNFDWGKLGLGIGAYCERRSDLVPTDKVGKEEGELHYPCVGQAGVSFQKFSLIGSYGRYFPVDKTHGGYLGFHLRYTYVVKQVEDMIKLAIIPMASVGMAQNLPNGPYKVPLLASEGHGRYPIGMFGLVLKFGDSFQPNWPYEN